VFAVQFARMLLLIFRSYKDGAALESSASDSNPRVSYFIFRCSQRASVLCAQPHRRGRVVMNRKDKADSHADSFRSKVAPERRCALAHMSHALAGDGKQTDARHGKGAEASARNHILVANINYPNIAVITYILKLEQSHGFTCLHG
jgi:hypothetical protein